MAPIERRGRGRDAVAVVLLTGLIIWGCSDGKQCKPTDRMACLEGAMYAIDSCGEPTEMLSRCPCGCLEDQSGCIPDCTAAEVDGGPPDGGVPDGGGDAGGDGPGADTAGDRPGGDGVETCTPPDSRPCYPGPAGTEGVGACRAGSQECVGGTWSRCTGAVVPAAEVCNGQDDDCDGTTDLNGCVPDGMLIEVSPPYTEGNMTYGDEHPAVAFDGTNFLVVWEDQRATNPDIYAARVTPAGQVLDPDGIPVAVLPGEQQTPSVNFDGTNFLVVWYDQHTDPGNGRMSGVHAALVSPAGAVLDQDGFLVSSRASRSPVVAHGGASHLVAWILLSTNQVGETVCEIHGARVDPDGTVVDDDPVLLAGPYPSMRDPWLAYGADAFLLVWGDDSEQVNPEQTVQDVYGMMVDTNGGLTAGPRFAVTTAPGANRASRAAFGGTRFLVAWYHNLIEGGSYVQDGVDAARVGADGTLQDADGIDLNTDVEVGQYDPSVTYDGSNFQVVYRDMRMGCGGAIYMSAVSAGGQVRNPAGTAVFIDESCRTGSEEEGPGHYVDSLAAARGGDQILVVWASMHAGIYAVRVQP